MREICEFFDPSSSIVRWFLTFADTTACVPIFVGGSGWSCDFLNVNGTSFLLQHDDRFPGQPECCVFEPRWNPPAPSFLENVPLFKTTTLNSELVDWFQLNVSIANGGPFGYGFFRRSKVPAGFYFGGLWNLG
jgi:hypothetical protein